MSKKTKTKNAKGKGEGREKPWLLVKQKQKTTPAIKQCWNPGQQNKGKIKRGRHVNEIEKTGQSIKGGRRKREIRWA